MPLPSTGPISLNDISTAFYKPAQMSAQTFSTEQADPQSLGFNFTVLNFTSQSSWPDVNVFMYKLYSGNPGYYGYWLYVDSERIPLTTAQGEQLNQSSSSYSTIVTYGNITYKITATGTSHSISYFSVDGSNWTDISNGTARSITVTRSTSANTLYQVRTGVSPVGQLHSGYEFNPRDPNFDDEPWPILRNNVSLTYDSTNSKHLLAVSYGSEYYNLGYRTRIYILTPTSGSIGFTNQYVDIIVNDSSTNLYKIDSYDDSYGAIKIHFHTGCNKIMLLCQGESHTANGGPSIILKVGTLSYTGSNPTFTWQSTTTLSPSTNNNYPPTLDLQQHPTEANKALIFYKINRFGTTPWVLKPITVATNGSITLGVETTVQAADSIHNAELLFAQQNAFVIRAFNQEYVSNIELTTGVYTIGSTDAQDSVSVDSTTIVSTSAASKYDNQKGTIFIPDKNLYIIAYHKTGDKPIVRPFTIDSSTRAITLGVETELPTMTGSDRSGWLSLGFRSDLNLPCIIISRFGSGNPSKFFEAQSFDIVQHPTDASLNTVSPRALHTDTSLYFQMPSRNQILFDTVKRYFLVLGSTDVSYGSYYAGQLLVYEGHKPLSFTNYRSVTAVPQLISVSLENGAASVTNTNSASLTISARDDDAITHYIVKESNSTPAATDSGWVSWPVNTAFTWTATGTAGTYAKTAYVWVKDAQNNISNMRSDSINYIVVAVPPTNISFSLEGGATSIQDSTEVSIEMSATNVASYFISEINSTPSASDDDWYTYAATGNKTIISGFDSHGTFARTVYIWFKSPTNQVNTTPLSDSIDYIKTTTPTYAANAWFAGGYTSGNASFHKMSFASMSNGIRNGQLTSSVTYGSFPGGSNHYKMIASCYNTHNNSDIKDLSSNANATTHGTVANIHSYGMADGNSTVLLYHSGWNGSSNTANQSKQSYASASSSNCSSAIQTRHGYMVSDYNNTTLSGAGDSSSYRHANSYETSISSCSVSAVGGLPQVMYVMEAAGNANYACISGSYGNAPYQHLGKIDRYSYASNSFTNQWLTITATHGYSVSDRNDTCFHGKGSGTGWEKFSISSGGTKTDIGNGGNKGAVCRGSGV